MKKGLFLMTALLFVSGASMAQKVVNVDGKAIIDNRAMPAKAITKDKKARTTDGTNVGLGTNDLNNLGSKETNKTVSHYFEVMKHSLDNEKTMNWLTAIQGCVDYDDNTWRLPTQRELMLIWTLHVSLNNKVTDFVLFNSYYWSATETEYKTANSWYVFNGKTVDVSKTTLYRVRCVRDLTPPAK